jgi:hypothetical protein
MRLRCARCARWAGLAALAIALGCGGGGDDDDDAPAGDAGAGGECGPAGGGPYWIVEGETVEFDAACTSGDAVAIALDEVPDGASWDGGHFAWTPGLDQAAVYHLQLSAGDEVGEVVVGVADALGVDGNQPIADPTTYTHELGLPVMFLSPAPTAEEPYQPTTIIYGGVTYQAEGKLRGASSLGYPKKSYTLKFDAAKFSDPDQDGGFIEKDRVVLTSTFDDNSYLRQWLSFELWSRLEPTMPVQAYLAVVYVDGEYFGLYAVTDHLDDELMKALGLSENGNLYKAINHDANFRGLDSGKTTLHDGYEKKEGDPPEGEPGAFDDLDALVEFVATASDDDFAAGIGERVLLDDYEKWWMLATFTRADDSAGKNSYHYHDATRAWRVAPWDFNASFGQAWTSHRVSAAPADPYAGANHLFERLLADPELGDAMRDHYREARGDGGALERSAVLELFDSMAATVERSAARDWSVWEDEYRNYGLWNDRTDWTTPAEETAYVREWVIGRVEAVGTLLAQ